MYRLTDSDCLLEPQRDLGSVTYVQSKKIQAHAYRMGKTQDAVTGAMVFVIFKDLASVAMERSNLGFRYVMAPRMLMLDFAYKRNLDGDLSRQDGGSGANL